MPPLDFEEPIRELGGRLAAVFGLNLAVLAGVRGGLAGWMPTGGRFWLRCVLAAVGITAFQALCYLTQVPPILLLVAFFAGGPFFLSWSFALPKWWQGMIVLLIYAGLVVVIYVLIALMLSGGVSLT